MELSCFTPLGFLELSDDTSYAEQIYDSLISSLGGNYATEEGSRAEAWCYATALQIAQARLTLEHAGLQKSPLCVDEMMADREAEWQIVPGPSDTLWDRRRALAARMLLPTGASRGALQAALETLLGDDFVALRYVTPAENAWWPTTLGDRHMSLPVAGVERKRLRVTQPVSAGLGAPQAVSYEMVDGQPDLLSGDRLLVETEVLGRSESVVVSGVTDTHFTATFEDAHEPDCLCTTAPYPMSVGLQRSLLVVLSLIPAVDSPTRTKVNEQLQRQARGVTTWAVVQQATDTTTGPFTIEYSPRDATPLGEITF